MRTQALIGQGRALSLLLHNREDAAVAAEAISVYSAIADSAAADEKPTQSGDGRANPPAAARADTPPPGPAARRLALAEDAEQARSRYRAGHGISELNRAITCTRLLSRLDRTSTADYASHLAALADDLRERFDETGRPADADEALTIAPRCSPSGVPTRGPWRRTVRGGERVARQSQSYRRRRCAGKSDLRATRSIHVAPADEPGLARIATTRSGISSCAASEGGRGHRRRRTAGQVNSGKRSDCRPG